ncbi:2Fe-2S iron-sulfur cluster-binding protein [Nonomuraea sp. B12E4]|uniref:(2Fe-2S)-binding protein n=1 Tax=Nonomuraea sp. B12E4 TaxID=3153564 RepID=UPI00325F63C2
MTEARSAVDQDTGEVPHVEITLDVNGVPYGLRVDARVTLLDALRDHLGLTGAKKGCDQGACGACTVLIDGRRVVACLTLAAQCEDRRITTIESLAEGGTPHPLQTMLGCRPRDVGGVDVALKGGRRPCGWNRRSAAERRKVQDDGASVWPAVLWKISAPSSARSAAYPSGR